MPSGKAVNWARKNGAIVKVIQNPMEAAKDANAVLTDTWVSMGENFNEDPEKIFNKFQVNKNIMNQASKEAIFMHCLPAHRGQEVTTEVIDGSNSVVWDEAENRLHIQKAILTWAILGKKNI